MLDIPDDELKRYPDFRRYVLEVAQREINEYTDLNVYFEPMTKGRKVVQIRFHIAEKSDIERIANEYKVNEILDN